MPEVSVIMNCFNGEKYLKEALDSVFAQSFEDWELIFVDNCSTDRSVQIALSYGDSVKIIKNQETVPLGASRNVGIENSSGDYIAFLDVDDIWNECALEAQLKAIKSSDYALSYGAHTNIDSNGNIIGEWRPKVKSGFIFPVLLTQFDIPIVTSMLSRKALEETGLMFDSNVYASEEYCLFMQLAATKNIIALEGVLTKYRIHDDALTNKSIDKWAKERRYTLDKIKAEHSELEDKYHLEFKEAYARAAYYDAQYFMSLGNRKKAAEALLPYRFLNIIYFSLYVLICFFPFVWKAIQSFKYKRVI